MKKLLVISILFSGLTAFAGQEIELRCSDALAVRRYEKDVKKGVVTLDRYSFQSEEEIVIENPKVTISEKNIVKQGPSVQYWTALMSFEEVGSPRPVFTDLMLCVETTYQVK